jgi:hypothetical protein
MKIFVKLNGLHPLKKLRKAIISNITDMMLGEIQAKLFGIIIDKIGNIGIKLPLSIVI